MISVAIVALIGLLSLGNGPIQSQQSPPVPIQQKSNSAIESTEQPKQQENTSPNSVSNIKTAPGIDLKSESPNHANNGPEDSTEFTVLLGHKLKITDVFLSFFTFLLVIVTALLAYIAWRQDETNRMVQRAYVKMSHKSPGLLIFQPFHMYQVLLNIKNFGETPATITGVALTHKILAPGELLPTIPEYADGTGNLVRRVFLVREDEFFAGQAIEVSANDFGDVENGAMNLFIYGYVDYVDRFSKRHRAGYARRYTPSENIRPPHVTDEHFNNRSNLLYVTQPSYNYDSIRKNCEGNDWNEPI